MCVGMYVYVCVYINHPNVNYLDFSATTSALQSPLYPDGSRQSTVSLALQLAKYVTTL